MFDNIKTIIKNWNLIDSIVYDKKYNTAILNIKRDGEIFYTCNWKENITFEIVDMRNLYKYTQLTYEIIIDWKVYEEWEINFNNWFLEEKYNNINNLKIIEKKSIEKRTEYLTCELLPECDFKTLKINKLIEEGDELKKIYQETLEQLINIYWEEIIQELI